MKRSILGILLGVVLGAGGFFIAAGAIKQPLRIEELWPIVLAVGVVLIVWLIQGTAMAILARPQLDGLPILKTTRVYLASQAVGGITPFAGGEIGYQLLELKRIGVPVDLGGAIITIKSGIYGIILIFGAVTGLLFVSNIPFVGGGREMPFSGDQILLVAAGVFILLWIIAGFVIRRRRSNGEAENRSEGASGWREKLSGFFRDYKHSLSRLWHEDPWAIAICGALMLVFWTLYPLLGVFSLMAAGWSGEQWLPVFFAQYVLFLLIPLAPTPGNSGAAEIAFVALMGAYVPHETLLGGMLIWRILNHFVEIVLGAFLAGGSVWDDVEIARQEIGSD